MKILIITREDPFFVPIYLKPLISKYKKNVSVVILGNLPPYLTIGYLFSLIKRYTFSVFALKMFQYAFYSVWAKWKKSIPERFFSVKDLCSYYSADFLQTNDLHSQEMLNWYKKQKADILLSVMSPVIFKKQLLNCAKLAINIHPSLLPSFKGIDPIFWAIKSNEKVFGVTIHQMVEKVDEGKTFIQQEIPLQNGISVHQGNYKAAVLGGKMLVGLLSLGLNKIKRLRYHAKKQYKPSFYSTPKTADFRQLINSGKKLVIIKDCFPFFETY